MASELAFFRFLRKLPEKDRNLYLWLNSYREGLARFNNCPPEIQNEVQSLLEELFEPEINKVVELPNTPIFDTHHRKDRAERSISKPKPLAKIDAELDEKLGPWVSSSSDDDDDSKRLSNESDLSSGDESQYPITGEIVRIISPLDKPTLTPMLPPRTSSLTVPDQ